MPFLIKLDIFSAWVLFITVILYGITGYAMTKGIIPVSLATNMHLGLLGVFTLIAFVIHTSWAIHLFLKRKNFWNSFSKILLCIFYLLLIGFFLFVHFIYQPSLFTAPIDTKIASVDQGQDLNLINTKQIFTAETLKIYNGQNGQPAYVAVDGVVYDMSTIFNGGNHYGYTAGQDLSAIFHQKHSLNYLQGLQIMGVYR
jgi:predicted heme/steroid binding protein